MHDVGTTSERYIVSSVSPTQVALLNGVCATFERAWKSGQKALQNLGMVSERRRKPEEQV